MRSGLAANLSLIRTPMMRVAPVDLQKGERTIRQLYPQGPIVHLTNYGQERISKADHTQPDTSSLGGRSLIALSSDDYVLTPAHEAALHKAMAGYYHSRGIPAIDPRHIIAVPSPRFRRGFAADMEDFVTPVCQTAMTWLQRDPAALQALIQGAHYMVPFIVSENSEKIARGLGLQMATTGHAVDVGNNKKYLPEAAQKFDFNTPPTLQPFSLEEVANQFDDLIAISKQYPGMFEPKIWVKLNRSSGGEGTVSFTDRSDLLRWLQHDHQGRDFAASMIDPADNEGIVLQLGIKGRKIDAIPNYNIFVGHDAKSARDIGGSAQVIHKEVFHVGNNGMLPESDRALINPVGAKVADWLRSIGFHDVFGFDVVIGEDGQVWVIDVNARWNASTSTTILHNDFAGHEGTRKFRYTGKIRVPREIDPHDFFAHLRSQKAEFSFDKGGVLPINFMTAHRPDFDTNPEATPSLNASIFAPTDEGLQRFFELAQMLS